MSGDGIAVQADKSWVTTAGSPTSASVVSVSSADDGAASDVDLYAVPADTPNRGLRECLRQWPSTFASQFVSRLREAGGGFGIMMQTVLPWFNLGNAAVSLGLATAATRAVKHVGTARFRRTVA